jgi:CubicO group peptidase (beta-lactamase class C family)
MIDWQRGPYNRWAFQKVNEVVPTEIVGKGDGELSPLVRDLQPMAADESRGLLSLSGRASTGDIQNLADELTGTYTDALVVAHRGRLMLEHYANGMMPTTRHLLMSVSKTFAGVLAGQAIEAGTLLETAPVTDYVPELAGSAYGNATVRDVLDMVVAVEFSEDYPDPDSEVQQQDRVAGWRDRLPGDPADTYAFLPTLRASGKYGEAFQYCSADTDVLGWILERVSGLAYPKLLEQNLWARIGASTDAFITVDPGGFAMANGGLCVTARDLVVYGQAILDGADCIPTIWLSGVREGGDPAIAGEELNKLAPRGSYRGHFWHLGDENRCFMGWGIYGQYLFIDPTNEVVIAKFSTEPEPVTVFSRQRHLALLQRLSRLVAQAL